MKIACVHCGGELRLGAAHLGRSVVCPHCSKTMSVPAVAEPESEPVEQERRHWLENSISTLASVLFHTALVIVLALVTHGAPGIVGEGEVAAIGHLPEVVLEEDEPMAELEDSASVASDASEASLELQLEAPVSAASGGESLSIADLAAPTSGGGQLDLGMVGIGGSASGGGSWEGMLQTLRRNGLDIVIAFDSTGSMGGEIDEVKRQVDRIGRALLTLVPKARISLCTYRDQGDDFVVVGTPLTSDLATLKSFLYRIDAGGGGDTPEAVDAGLQWAITQNDFHTQARKVILVFGDAPPHPEKLSLCLKLASDFNRQSGGIVSTVTCRSRRPLPQFQQIANSGGGEAFLTTDERQIMTQLMVLVFGAQHRDKVMEAFKLLD